MREIFRPINALILSGAVALSCGAPRPSESSTEEPNLVTAGEFLRDSGIHSTFLEARPSDLYNANLRLAQDPEFDTKAWEIFHDQSGKPLLIALDLIGEPIQARMGNDGKFHSTQFEVESYTDADSPELLYSFSLNVKGEPRNFGIVGYGDQKKNETLMSILNSDPLNTVNLMQVIFAHSEAKLNLLHLGDQGIPSTPFNFPGMEERDFVMLEDQLPETWVEGASVIISRDGNPLRADVFLSPPAIQAEAEVSGMPEEAVFAGMLANEAYGIAISTHRIRNNLPFTQGRHEAGSTGADWGTILQIAEGSSSAFFFDQELVLINRIYQTLTNKPVL